MLSISVPVSGRLYATLWILTTLLLPPILALFYGSAHPVWYSSAAGTWISWLAFAANIGLLIFVMKRAGSSVVSYWTGISILAAKKETGCLNVSVIVLPLYLMYVYLTAIVMAFVGLARRRTWTQAWWLNRILNPVPAVIPKQSNLSNMEAGVLNYASLVLQSDFRRPENLWLFALETDITPARILAYIAEDKNKLRADTESAKPSNTGSGN